ncbi:MAG: cysteine desulfurase family protein [bacterium]|nr:cysteine desulfurase family protein [bacterium]
MTIDKSKARIYLDYSSVTPVDERVLAFAQKFLTTALANPLGLHRSGQEAGMAIEEARLQVANLIHAEDPKSIVFTSGATEAINIAVRGTALRHKDKGRRIAVSAIEHISTFNSSKDLKKNGYELAVIPVDSTGLLLLDELRRRLTRETTVTSIMYANSEIGTVQPIFEISRIVHEQGMYLHVDATVAAGKIAIDVQKEEIDLLTLSSNELGGPQGAGALYIKPGVKVQPVSFGGGQERGLRSGTENLFAIAGMGEAARLAAAELGENQRLVRLRDELIEAISTIPGARLTGHPHHRLPNHVSFVFTGVEGESIILNLDAEYNIQAATGSACSARTLEPSHVLVAIGLEAEEAHSSLVMTLGRTTQQSELPYIINAVKQTVEKLRGLDWA